MQDNLNTNGPIQDEVSVKEIVARMRVKLVFLWGYKVSLSLITVLCAAIGFGYAHFEKSITYTSHLTFAVEEKSGGSAFSGLAS